SGCRGDSTRTSSSRGSPTSCAVSRTGPLRLIEDVPRVAVVPDEPNPFAAEAYEQAVDRPSVGLLARKDRRPAVHLAGLQAHAIQPRVVVEVAAHVRGAALLAHPNQLE